MWIKLSLSINEQLHRNKFYWGHFFVFLRMLRDKDNIRDNVQPASFKSKSNPNRVAMRGGILYHLE